MGRRTCARIVVSIEALATMGQPRGRGVLDDPVTIPACDQRHFEDQFSGRRDSRERPD